MKIEELTAGMKVVMEDCSIGEVVTPSSNGRSVQVKYIKAPFDPSLIGTQAVCSDYEIVAYVLGSWTDAEAPLSTFWIDLVG